MKNLRPRFSEKWTFCFIVLATMASTFPNYAVFTVLKAFLLLLSIGIIFLSGSLVQIRKNRLIFVYFIYFIYLLANIKTLDEYSLRIVFNGVVILAAAYALTFLDVNRRHIIVSMILIVAFFAYAFFFNRDGVNNKPQVHAQILGFIYVSTMLFYQKHWRLFSVTTALILISSVRSALFGYLPLMVFTLMPKTRNSKYFLLAATIAVPSVAFYLMTENLHLLSELFGRQADSFRWRVLHWENIFQDFDGKDWLFGKGLGYSWRMSLDIDAFYATGHSVIASHGNYVKIASETGLFGLAIFGSLVVYIYRVSPAPIQALVSFYVGYGFFDEGVWHFDLFWLIALASLNLRAENDFNTVNYQRSTRLSR